MVCATAPHNVHRRGSVVSHPALLLMLLLLWLLICVDGATAQTTTTTANPENIVPTYNADPNTYYKTLTSQDATIFAGTSTSASSESANYPNLNMIAGLRTIFNIPNASSLYTTSKLQNSATAAVRADVLSEVFVTMALLHLESNGLLPFSRTGSIPSTYLPSSYTTANTFVSPNFPTIPITLNMMLQHISSITEAGFSIGASTAPSGTVPTLASFVSALFSTANVNIFGASQPGLSTSYTYSRTNTALVSYIVERILAETSNYSSLSGIGEFVFSVVLPPLDLSSTFLVNRNGAVIDTTYPFSSTNTENMQGYLARQDIDSAGTAVFTNYPTHASSFSDYMVFTTSADLAKLALQVFVPGGIYYSTIGVQMLQNPSPVSLPTMLYTTARTPGLFLFDASQLCSIMYAAVSYSGKVPYCYYSSNTVSATGPAFGLVATGGVNEIAIVCVPVASSSKTYCTAAEISFYDAGWRSGDAAVARNRAVGLAMVSLAYLTSEAMPVTTTTTAKPAAETFQGGFVAIGVLATLVVVIVAAYVTDYVIQPPPPAKIIAPVVTGQIGLRNGAATVADFGGTGAARGGDGLEPMDGGDDSDSPKAFHDPSTTTLTGSHRGAAHTHWPHNRHRRGGSEDLDDDVDDNDSDADDGEEGDASVTPYTLRSRAVDGGSSLRRRNAAPAQRARAAHGGHRAGQYAARDDGLGADLDDEDRSSTGSQRPNPDGRLRFDAYI